MYASRILYFCIFESLSVVLWSSHLKNAQYLSDQFILLI